MHACRHGHHQSGGTPRGQGFVTGMRASRAPMAFTGGAGLHTTTSPGMKETAQGPERQQRITGGLNPARPAHCRRRHIPPCPVLRSVPGRAVRAPRHAATAGTSGHTPQPARAESARPIPQSQPVASPEAPGQGVNEFGDRRCLVVVDLDHPATCGKEPSLRARRIGDAKRARAGHHHVPPGICTRAR